jgi:hypothetical protein
LRVLIVSVRAARLLERICVAVIIRILYRSGAIRNRFFTEKTPAKPILPDPRPHISALSAIKGRTARCVSCFFAPVVILTLNDTDPRESAQKS